MKRVLILSLILILSLSFQAKGKVTTKVDDLIFLYDGRKYYKETRQALRGANDSILVVMYLFKKYGESPSHPVNVLIKNLIEAKARGVKIKVTLDESRRFTKTGEIINQLAYDVLKKEGIDVSYDSSEKITHTKLIIYIFYMLYL